MLLRDQKPASSCFPGSSAASPKELEAWEPGSLPSVRRVSRAEGFKGADSLLDGGRSLAGMAQGASLRWGSVGRRWPSSPGVWNTTNLSSFGEPGWLGGLLEDPSSRCFHPPACKLWDRHRCVQLRQPHLGGPASHLPWPSGASAAAACGCGSHS